MRSRRAVAKRLLKTARPRRIIGTVLVVLGTIAWVSAIFLPVRERSLAIIFGGASVAAGIILITTSV
jgi:uncharacterized protein YjeT (DUF2065 family)